MVDEEAPIRTADDWPAPPPLMTRLRSVLRVSALCGALIAIGMLVPAIRTISTPGWIAVVVIWGLGTLYWTAIELEKWRVLRK